MPTFYLASYKRHDRVLNNKYNSRSNNWQYITQKQFNNCTLSIVDSFKAKFLPPFFKWASRFFPSRNPAHMKIFCITKDNLAGSVSYRKKPIWCSYIRSRGSKTNVTLPHVIKRPRAMHPTSDKSFVIMPPIPHARYVSSRVILGDIM